MATCACNNNKQDVMVAGVTLWRRAPGDCTQMNPQYKFKVGVLSRLVA